MTTDAHPAITALFDLLPHPSEGMTEDQLRHFMDALRGVVRLVYPPAPPPDDATGEGA